MRFLIIIALAAFTGCTKKGEEDSGSTSSTDHLSFNFKVNSSYTLGLPGAMAVETPIPLVFNSVGVAGFYFRPNLGAANQTGQADGSYTSDHWSVWEMLPENANNNREFFVPRGGVLDIRNLAIDAGNGDDQFYRDITTDFAENVGAFRMDMIFVSARLGLVNQNSTVCGAIGHSWNGSVVGLAPLILNWNTPCQSRQIKSSLDNAFLVFPKVIFARKDWFPTSIQIQYFNDNASKLACYATDSPLSAFQVEILDSLLSSFQNVTTVNGWIPGKYQPTCSNAGGGFGFMSIVPQSGDVPSVQLTVLKVPQDPAITPDGRSFPTPPLVFIGHKMQADVSFNVVPSMFVDWASFNTDSDTSDIFLNLTSGGAPYGLTIDFSVVTPAKTE